MSFMGRLLRLGHLASACCLAATVVTGYAVSLGWAGARSHIGSSFFIALFVALTHAMTLFYFAGIGVSLRESAAGRRDLVVHLDAAARLRARLAPIMGLALMCLVGAVVAGGGAHTQRLSGWVHHSVSLAAVALNLYAAWLSRRLIGRLEEITGVLEEALGLAAGR